MSSTTFLLTGLFRHFCLGKVALLPAAMFVALLFSMNEARAGGNQLFQTESLCLAFESETGAVVRWDVNPGDPSGGEPWKSVLTRDFSGQVLSRHLFLEGVDEYAAKWSEPGKKDEVLCAGTADGGRLAVGTTISSKTDYRVLLRIEIENISSDAAAPRNDIRLLLGPGLGEYPAGGFGIAEGMYSYVKPVASIEGEIVEIDEDAAHLSPDAARYEWIGLHSRYFALLLSPLDESAEHPGDVVYSSPAHGSDGGIPGRYLPRLSIGLNVGALNPGETVYRDFLVFSGPKTSAALKGGDSDYSGIIFSGLWSWMALLCSGMLWILKAIHAVVPNWGLAIILLAVLVRIMIYPAARRMLASQREFAELQKVIQPELQAIKREYRGGEQSERILKLYERHGVSPLAGLKPLLIVAVQLPIFVALFHVLGRAYELRAASFLWIETLAEPDRLFHMGVNLPFFGEYFNFLPVLMAATTLLTIKISPAPSAGKAERTRQNIFLVALAAAFFLLFYPFPSGMVLYWTMANVLHLLQQKRGQATF